MGGVKCEPFLKHSIPLETGFKNDYQVKLGFQFHEAVVTSPVKDSLCSTERSSLQVLAV